MTTRKITLLLIATVLLASTATVMRAQSIQHAAQSGIPDGVEHMSQPPEQRLEGTWRVQLTPVNCQTGAASPATGRSINTFARGGSLVAAPALPGPPLLGVWKHVEGRSENGFK